MIAPAGLLAIATVTASAALTRLALAYARRRRMLDLPGARRSHDMPTPRGGGIAPAVVAIAGGTWLALLHPQAAASWIASLAGLGMVTGIGWLDDHRPLPAWPRLLVHVAAGLLASIAAVGMPHAVGSWLLVGIASLAVAGLVNAWNFMDGIDGLAASQAAFAMLALLVGGWLEGAWRTWCWISLLAIIGFLPFNTPKARIFLGDAGSGALGYLVAVMSLHAMADGTLPWPLALLPPSAFLLDAGLTLGQRMWRGRAWWRAHREHLYQWLVRSGRAHATVAACYAAWALGASVLAVGLALRTPGVRLLLTLAWLSCGVLVWAGLRTWLWSNARSRR
ncbi:MAG: glycosyltransferase family 4 protein [Proteobacteria bacterium]|nr:glycosyltransferase family 4 protein [Pseudomonadota bacterium]